MIGTTRVEFSTAKDMTLLIIMRTNAAKAQAYFERLLACARHQQAMETPRRNGWQPW